MFESIDKIHEFLTGKPQDSKNGKGGEKDDKIEIDDNTVNRIAEAVINKLNNTTKSKQEETENEESEDDN